MNKNIKRTVAMTLTLSALAASVPTTSINILGAQEVSAASKIKFDSLRVSGAGNVKLSSSKTKYSIYVPKNQESATITIKKDSSSDVIDVSGDGITSIQGEGSGDNTCKIKVDLDQKGSKANEYEIKVTNGDKETTYTLKIYRKTVSKDDDEDNDDIYLDSINLSDGSIDFSRKKAQFDVVVDKNVDSIKIQAKPEDKDYKVEIGGEEVDEDNKWRTEVNLKEGKNVVEITIEDEDDDDNPQRTYKLNIYRGTKPSSTTATGEIDTKQDSIYIKKLVLNDGDVPVTFDKRITSYDITVNKDLDDIIVKAQPENDDDLVKINGSKADSNYRKRVALNSTGTTTIEIKVYSDLDDDDDDYEERIYNLNIKKSGTKNESTGTNNNQNTNVNKGDNLSVKTNQWVKNVYGLWEYHDAAGNLLKNQWFDDGGKRYYLDNYGIMQTGWLQQGSTWYYLDTSGVMKTGWVNDRGNWYYMNSDGTMKTGWLLDTNGKWYYLNGNGLMLSNVYVGSYKLGADGAWIR
ncbi:N-acetylmuramoyl-L-alanine amidase family protein [uncultured Clostridium sp.]|uniref:N-acetylmuramoyl-L-alanine amidase family protein n=1 Tax=uncultured Clostridium sp. TaxID=59620 RepID=UPI002601405F|nr:cadherin-like beta sandwich domain-containing protein [uncultured Clostridium sp.]